MQRKDTLSRDEYDRLDEPEMALFYVDDEDTTEVRFDPEGDERLTAMHIGDVTQFNSAINFQLYESLVERSAYECKVHPQLTAMQQFVSDELAGDVLPDELIVLVYKRDSAARSSVTLRRLNPFKNGTNGIGSSAEASVVLFGKHNLEPKFRAKIVWMIEPRLNSTLGTVAFRVEEGF
jgi:hypothetical protein